ncbi:MAG: phospholipase C, phosphocholine-specific [Chryseolinea sp.]
MDTRREFLKKVAALTATAGVPRSIARALAIDPVVGSTYLDAEHVVILMQENRSFDHCYGTLQGVRGFNDPRAIRQPNNNLVWMQTNAEGETYIPFRLDIQDTRSTWMGSLPHSWTDQVDARNGGKYDQWLNAKHSGHKEYRNMPLTLGYHTREDLPFYYSLADAFTVCDQNFCSSLTGTTPNRLYLWTGTIREKPSTSEYANVRNENVDYDRLAHWTTFPERLEKHNVSWKIYQNEISVGVGFKGEEDAWLSNFTDNPIEWFARYNVKFAKVYRDFLPERIKQIKEEIVKLEGLAVTIDSTEERSKKLVELESELRISEEDLGFYTNENYLKLSDFEKNIHDKAFTTNRNDPYYHELVTMKYTDGPVEREVLVPAGDILHQFREDVKNKKLPTVSWLVAPENFSDHPGAPWYGAWYVSEVMDILTKDPETWKKTVFILAYDENDGYFDHVPPFTVPDPTLKHSGKVSEGINVDVEFVTLDQDKRKKDSEHSRQNSIGLGYRVPLVIASPWSRGGMVCSEVFDHTSILQFLEKFLSNKTGKKIEESNISAWRRSICGDLTSAFKSYKGEKIEFPITLQKTKFIERVHKAQFKDVPKGYKSLNAEQILDVNRDPLSLKFFPRQESGTRSACPLPYELYAEGKLSEDIKKFEISLASGKDVFGLKAVGAPFNIYAPGKYKDESTKDFTQAKNWSYAVNAGDRLQDSFDLANFVDQNYFLQVYGPNGFFRELKGNQGDPLIAVECIYEKSANKLTGSVILRLKNKANKLMTILITDNAYEAKPIHKTLKACKSSEVVVDLSRSYRWYDFTLSIDGAHQYARRYAGRVENGEPGLTDPAIGATDRKL